MRRRNGIRDGLAATAMTALWALSMPHALAEPSSVAPVAISSKVQAALGYLSMSDEELLRGTDKPGSYYPDLHRCPVACVAAPTDPRNWTKYTSMDQFSRCSEPLLFDFVVSNPVADRTTPNKMRVCSLESSSTAGGNTSSVAGIKREAAILPTRDATASKACVAPVYKTTATMEVARSGQAVGKSEDAVTALEALVQYFSLDCSAPLMLSSVNGVFAGLYIGSGFGHDTVSSAIEALSKQIKASGDTATTISQLCGIGKTPSETFGVAVSAVGNLTEVQNALYSWTQAACVTGLETTELGSFPVWQSRPTFNNSTEPANTTFANSTIQSRFGRHAVFNAPQAARLTIPARENSKKIGRRGLCQLETVAYGDLCPAIATRCGISTSDFTKFNPTLDCGLLMPGQYVCCSEGGMDDLIPKPGDDGICATYHVVTGDTCNSIAGRYAITAQDIEDWNKGKTYGWYGCGKMLVDTNICISDGKRPMPYPDSKAICGPTVVGSDATYVEDNDELINLNSCPLNACCNVWGNCGISGDFCNVQPTELGNPGTSALQNGCVSNCGTDIKNNDEAPAAFQRVGYYETWNFNRPCLWMAAKTAGNLRGDGAPYTHIHWAFAGVNTADWTVNIDDPFGQWDDFKKLDQRRIVSFGGWGYSTEPETYDILREAMSPANRATFAANVAKFLSDEGIDGIDFDWEYPGATDIPGTPPGDPQDGLNYFKFLSVMRTKLPAGASLSIAAPASYWYLRAFPIDMMANVLDYIVYMTYDLHGQWDAGNQYSMEGCTGGNCLRSHVNLTETRTALSMITKAGVKTNIIFVGESSYGRSFKMAQAGCTGPDCTFTGDRLNSNAAKGECTDTSGYISNAEINEIIESGKVAINAYYDAASDSDILVYDQTEWVAYMTDETKMRRRSLWSGQNFAGTIDWAVDLQAFTDDEPNIYEVVYLDQIIYTGTPAECEPPCILVLPPSPLHSTTTITIDDYTTSLGFLPGVTATVVVQVPPITIDSMPFSNVNATMGMLGGTFIPTASVDIPPIVTTITGPSGLTQTRTLTLPPWPALTGGPPASWTSSTGGPWLTPTSTSRDPPVYPSIDTGPTSYPADWGPPYTGEAPSTSSTAVPWPPSWSVEPVDEEVPEDGEDDDDIGPLYKTTCKLWFFFICVSWEGIIIGGWEWELPTGVWGPGPPPLDKIKLPPNINIRGSLPPWPKITIHPGGQPEYEPKPTDCEPAEASLCLTTSSFGTTVSDQVTRTTATEVKSTCLTITGCNLQDVESTTTVKACEATPGPLGKREPDWWSCEDDGQDGIVLPIDPQNNAEVDEIRALLDDRQAALGLGYKEIRANDLGFTAFFYVTNMGHQAEDNLSLLDGVGVVYHFAQHILDEGWTADSPNIGRKRKRRSLIPGKGNNTSIPASTLNKRSVSEDTSDFWNLAAMSIPPDVSFNVKDGDHDPANDKWTYYFDESLGEGQTIYFLENGFSDIAEFLGRTPQSIKLQNYGHAVPIDADASHGTMVASLAFGKFAGMARKATGVHVELPGYVNPKWPVERWLEAIVNTANDMALRPKGTTVVNMSWGLHPDWAPQFMWRVMRYLMEAMRAKYEPVFLIAAGNDGEVGDGSVDNMPALLGREVPEIIVVGGCDKNGKLWHSSQRGDLVDVYAPGGNLPYPVGWPYEEYDEGEAGTSYATPLVAGLAANLRAMPGMNVFYSGEVKSKILELARNIKVDPDPGGVAVKVAWNGQIKQSTCTSGSAAKRGLSGRQDGGSCSLPSNPGSPGGGDSGSGPQGPPITFEQGPPAPTCTSGCGKLCAGDYCIPNPTGVPGDFDSPTPVSGPDDLCKPATTTAASKIYTYCDCGTGYASTMPFMPATTAPCAYTSLPPICRFGAQPQENKAYCNCEGYPHTLPTLTTSTNVCGYTTFPDPWPYTMTNGDGAVIACETSSVSGGKTECAGDFYTATPAPPKPTSDPAKPRCIVGRTMMNNDASQGDLINVQIFDNGVEICYGGQTIWFASSSTEYDIDCGKDNGRGALGPGASVRITNNGGKIVYKAADGWESEIPRTNNWHEVQDCGTYRCSVYESTFDNGCSNCPTFGFCNYWSYCPLDGDGACS